MLTKFNHHYMSTGFTLGLIISGLLISAPVSATSDTILLYTAGSHDGNLGGREGADAFCATQTPSGYTRVRAFLSVKEADEIRDMPTNYQISRTAPILGTTGTPIANNWEDLLDGSIAENLNTAIADLGLAGWWSGSYTDGSLRNENCSQWSSNSSGQFGSVGTSIFTTALWINSGAAAACQLSSFTLSLIPLKMKVLCVAYTPVESVTTNDEPPPSPIIEPPTDTPPPSEPPSASELPATIPSSSSTPAIALSENVLNTVAEIKIVREGIEIASSATDANLLDRLLYGDYEPDSSLNCGTTYHYEIQTTMVTGEVTTMSKEKTTPACPTVINEPVYMPGIPSEYALFSRVEGTGTGTVRSNTGGLFCHTKNCQATTTNNNSGHFENGCDPDFCKEVLEIQTPVELIPQADPGSVFSSWGGHTDCADSEVWMTGGRLCIAFFNKVYELSVTTVGQGSIRSHDFSYRPLSIDCRTGSTPTKKCRALFSYGTSLVLTAISENGAVFKGWRGDCEPQGNQAEMVIKMTQDKHCIAQFE